MHPLRPSFLSYPYDTQEPEFPFLKQVPFENEVQSSRPSALHFDPSVIDSEGGGGGGRDSSASNAARSGAASANRVSASLISSEYLHKSDVQTSSIRSQVAPAGLEILTVDPYSRPERLARRTRVRAVVAVRERAGVGVAIRSVVASWRLEPRVRRGRRGDGQRHVRGTARLQRPAGPRQ